MDNGNIIHFKSAKKQATYAKKEKQATENRVKFGRTKEEKRTNRFNNRKTNIHIDDHKLDDE